MSELIVLSVKYHIVSDQWEVTYKTFSELSELLGSEVGIKGYGVEWLKEFDVIEVASKNLKEVKDAKKVIKESLQISYGKKV